MTNEAHPREHRRGPWALRGGLVTSAVAICAAAGFLSCGDDEPSRPNPPDSPSNRTPKAARYLNGGLLRFYVSNSGRQLSGDDPAFLGRLGTPGANTEWGAASLISGMGLWIGATVAGETRVSATDFFSGDFGPAPLTPTSPVLTYLLEPGDHPGIPDYDLWPTQLGAPATQDGAHPRRIGDRTAWTMYNDLDPQQHDAFHGAPLGAIVRETSWMQPGFPSVLFVRYQIRNSSGTSWESTMLGVWTDADAGFAQNDLVGCDVPRDMTYTYTDPSRLEDAFGDAQPTLGVRLLKTRGDLGMTASAEQWKNLNEPANVDQAMNILNGADIDGSAFIDSTTGAQTKFWASGDPVARTSELWDVR